MSIQSPKSQRPQEPGQREKDDGMRETTKGGTHPECHAAGPSSPKVPAGTKHSGGGHQGNTGAEAYVSVGSAAPSQGGSPKMADKSGDSQRKGGSVHQT
jgi:hypothetical protein